MSLRHEWLALLTAGCLGIVVGCSKQSPSASSQPAVESSTPLTLPSQGQTPVTSGNLQVDSIPKVAGFAGIDANTIATYEKLGGVYCELEPKVGGTLSFIATEESLRTGLPGFRFSKWPKGELPPVSVPFGLGFSGLDVTDAKVEELLGLKNLAALDLSSTQVSDTGLKDIQGLEKLFALNLSQTSVTDLGVKEMKNITHLDISGTRATVSSVKDLNTLTSINLSDTHVTDADLKGLKKLSRLQSLNLSNTLVTDSGIKELNGLKDLVSLSLCHTILTKAGVKELNELKAIKSLDLAGTRFTNAGIKELTAFTELTHLNSSPA